MKHLLTISIEDEFGHKFGFNATTKIDDNMGLMNKIKQAISSQLEPLGYAENGGHLFTDKHYGIIQASLEVWIEQLEYKDNKFIQKPNSVSLKEIIEEFSRLSV